MTVNTYIKSLETKIKSREKKLKELSKKKYYPSSYMDFNGYYIQQEIKFIKGIICEYEKDVY